MSRSISVHSKVDLNAGALALVSTAIQNGLSLEEILIQAEQWGLNPEQPYLKQFISERYLHVGEG